MKSVLLLVNCVLLYNTFVSEAKIIFNQKRQPVSPSGPSVHSPLVISVSSKNSVDYVPSSPVEQVFILENGRKYLFACPAENEDSMEMTKNSSQTGYNLFIRTIYQTESKENAEKEESELNQAIKQTKCSKPVIPSFVHMAETIISSENLKYTIHSVGFEVYIEANIDGVILVKKKSPFFKLANRFQWYHVIEILFDPTKLDVKEVSYQMNAYRLEPIYVFTDLVQNYDLGKRELFGCVDIAALYTIVRLITHQQLHNLTLYRYKSLPMPEFFSSFSNWSNDLLNQDNQNRVFSNIFKNETERMKYFNVAEKKYLVQVHLAPLEVFAIPHIKEAARTYGNLAPMWRVIKENAWKKIEDFLQQVVHAVGPIDIISGLYETLKIASSENIFLGDNQVSVPLVFYKIVVFKKKNRETNTILIETINNPYEEVSGTLCDENQCEKYGWGSLQNDDYTTGRTLCCPVTEDHINLLSIQTLVSVAAEVFNLKNIILPLTDGSSVSAYDFIEKSRASPKPEKNLHRWLSLYQFPGGV